MTKTIKRDAKLIKAFLSARARMNSAKRKMDDLKEQLNLPTATKQTEGEYIVTDKNHIVSCNYTVFFKNGFEVESNWIGKIS